jgi:hypothetical protein
MKQRGSTKSVETSSGKLRIGDHWNAITIIALSQSNPLKAVAEFVENSIDAHARNITITRGKEHGQHYLRILDDGDGVPRNDAGMPDFKYVATHICDSIKRRMKEQGATGLQGEFGIGLLSFWTVGEEMSLTSTGADGHAYQMRMRKGDSGYSVRRTGKLIVECGTELKIWPLLAGIRQFSGEKIQWYLASELRDRIRKSSVQIRIVDHTARTELKVEPRQFTGRLLHQLPRIVSAAGEVYVELYLDEPNPANGIGLYRSGTRVLERITELDTFARQPWTSGYVQGIIDAPFINLTPGSRLGVVRDDAFAVFSESLAPLEAALSAIIEEQRRAEEEQTNRSTLLSIQKAFREALLLLPEEEYDWFNVRAGSDSRLRRRPQATGGNTPGLLQQAAAGDTCGADSASDLPAAAASSLEDAATPDERAEQKEFFEFAGPLFSIRVAPTVCVMAVGSSRAFRVIARDRERRLVDSQLSFHWQVADGGGTIDPCDQQIVTFTAPPEPCLTKIQVAVSQNAVTCTAEALITVTDSLLPKKTSWNEHQGLPGYTYQKAPGDLWRSRYDAEQNVIVINNGHRDFVYASRNKSVKLRYICRLFAKELVYKNFPGYSPDQLLERMIELSLYTEEHLR